MRFIEQILQIAERLELEQGWIVIPPIANVLGRNLTEQEKCLLAELHLQKIDLSDAVFVVNVGGYIGESVRREVEYAQAHEKEVLYLEVPHSSQVPLLKRHDTEGEFLWTS